jgi:hypothetical protein
VADGDAHEAAPALFGEAVIGGDGVGDLAVGVDELGDEFVQAKFEDLRDAGLLQSGIRLTQQLMRGRRLAIAIGQTAMLLASLS